MLVSLNALKKYVNWDLPTDELITLIGSRLVEVEEKINLAEKYKNIFIVKVVECEPIPDTHLHLCKIDAGSDPVQVVCGAPNVRKGMLAVWLAPGAIVPSTFGEENFKLGTRKLRGYESSGMLAALDELDLGTDHAGIVEIDPKTAHPGDSFAEVFDLNDIVLDIENKSLTHRPDCFGLIGFAREIAGITNQKFQEPDLFAVANTAADRLNTLLRPSDCRLLVEVADETLCPAYTAAVIDFEKLPEPSKYLTKSAVFLAKAGMRSIDPIVDLTNILMLETGQPLHAFDYDKFVAVGETKTPKIIVRAAAENEPLKLLDGKTINCTPNDILITSNNRPVALAGAMGGENTAIDASTKRIILESATFSLYNLRKTQMSHGIFSEAITRFTKGQPAALALPVLADAVAKLNQPLLALATHLPSHPPKNVVKITTSAINLTLGTNYIWNECVETLENVGFVVKSEPEKPFTITAPFWRTDIAIKEDIVEEIGRLRGYDNIAPTFPTRFFLGANQNPSLALKTKIREILSDRLAAHEVLTYSFVSQKLLEKVGQDPDDTYEIANSISPELQRFRNHLTPSLLDKIRENQKSGHKHFTLYELNQVTAKSLGLTPEKTPIMENRLGIVTLGNFYKQKAIATRLFSDLKVEVMFVQLAALNKKLGADHYPAFEPVRSAAILLRPIGAAKQSEMVPLGVIGEIRTTVLKRFKLEAPISALEIDTDVLLSAPKPLRTPALKLSKFPSVGRDLTFRTPVELAYADLVTALTSPLNTTDLVFDLTPTSAYSSDPAAKTINYAFHLKFASPDKTLENSEISDIIEKITKSAKQLGAEIV